MANAEEPIRKMGYGRLPSEDVQTPSSISVVQGDTQNQDRH